MRYFEEDGRVSKRTREKKQKTYQRKCWCNDMMEEDFVMQDDVMVESEPIVASCDSMTNSFETSDLSDIGVEEQQCLSEQEDVEEMEVDLKV